MVLEMAILHVKPAKDRAFLEAFSKAQRFIEGRPGYVSHQLQRCLEYPHRYLLLVEWRQMADHTEGFRKSPAYQEWKKLLHHFYDPFPEVEHYTLVYKNQN